MRGWPGFDVCLSHQNSYDAPDVNIKLVPASEEFYFFFFRFRFFFFFFGAFGIAYFVLGCSSA